jgi:NADPH-dependent 2,4-dienoyl-CoA reductase/sulfur reductase-like enzyme
VTHSPTGYTVSLSDGSTVSSDLVVAGLGAVPEIEWLAGSGLEVDDGIICDTEGRTSVAGIYAAGDVARWSAGDPQIRRHEHWTSAREQGRIVAQTIQGATGPRWEQTVPYVWSDQHGSRVQIVGSPRNAEVVEIVQRDEQTGAFVALYGRAGRLIAAVGCNRAGLITRQRALIARGSTFVAAVDAFASQTTSPRS